MISTAHKQQGENFCKKLCIQNTSHKKNEKKIFSTLPNSYYYILQISFKQLISLLFVNLSFRRRAKWPICQKGIYLEIFHYPLSLKIIINRNLSELAKEFYPRMKR